jgi:alkylated DNA repair protein alkB homolog 1
MPSYREKKARLRELVKVEEEARRLKVAEEGHPFNPVDAFRVREKEFRFYKDRHTDFSGVIDWRELKRREVAGKVVCEVGEPQGAYLVKGFIPEEKQWQLGFQAINDFVRRPYRTNLDGTNGLYLEKEEKMERMVEREGKVEDAGEGRVEEHVNKEEGREWAEEGLEPSKGYFFNDSIRMANLGYQYDWPHRCYPHSHVPIPPAVRQLTA